MTPQLALVTTGRYCVTVRIRKCNVCNVNKHYIPTRGVLFLCCHVQHVACFMLIEPKMSSGGRRAAEKSSCAHTFTYKIENAAGLRPRPCSAPDQSFSLPKAWAPRNRSVRLINISKGILMLTIQQRGPTIYPQFITKQKYLSLIHI